MTLYYSLVFLLLVLEILVFLGLIVPLPFPLRRKLFTFISESPLIAKLQYGLKITFIFILILFIDSVNRVYRVQLEVAAFTMEGGSSRAAALGDRAEAQARKFYSQRNMYLCGFTLFLSLILNRTYIMILDILRLEDRVRHLSKDKQEQAGSLDEATSLKREIETLKKRNDEFRKRAEDRERDLAALKEQAAGLTREYHALSDQMGTEDGSNKKDR